MKPLVLLDVDGVINDLGALYGLNRVYDIDVISSNGFRVHIPAYMPALIRQLVETAEVWWCTTWRSNANLEIASHLGIGPLPVIDDGSGRRSVDWKAAAALPLVTAALAEGRTVYWIEDFYGQLPTSELPAGVVFIDTAAATRNPVLLPGDLPSELRAA